MHCLVVRASQKLPNKWRHEGYRNMGVCGKYAKHYWTCCASPACKFHSCARRLTNWGRNWWPRTSIRFTFTIGSNATIMAVFWPTMICNKSHLPKTGSELSLSDAFSFPCTRFLRTTGQISPIGLRSFSPLHYRENSSAPAITVFHCCPGFVTSCTATTRCQSVRI